MLEPQATRERQVLIAVNNVKNVENRSSFCDDVWLLLEPILDCVPVPDLPLPFVHQHATPYLAYDMTISVMLQNKSSQKINSVEVTCT